MQRSSGQPFVPPSLLDRLTGLRARAHRFRAARRYAAHGWTVRRRGETVELATGSTLDALEVPAALGEATRFAGGPVAVTAGGRWIFLVRPGTPLCRELEQRVDVVRHGPDAWVAIAPSRLAEGPMRWVVPPAALRWRLPAAELVQNALVTALGAGPPPIRPAVPRQLSTTRRAA